MALACGSFLPFGQDEALPGKGAAPQKRRRPERPKTTNGTNSKRRKKTIAQGQKAPATTTPGCSKRLRPRRDGPSSGEGSSGQKKHEKSKGRGGGDVFGGAGALSSLSLIYICAV